MANSLILTKAQNAVTAHDWSTAARFYKELLRSDESNVEYLQQLGSIYVRAGQDEKAIPYYEQIITFNQNNTDAMVSLGAIFRRLKRYEDSVNILHKAQDISAGNPAINYNLGFTYKEMGDYDDAIDAFEIVTARNPDDVLAHNHLGSIYLAKKEHDKAITAFKRGLQVDQNHPILNYNLAHVYEEIKNYPEAVRCYEIALKTRPGWLDAIRDFSELLIRCQDTKQAQELVEQSIKLHPDDVDLLCILGRIYLNQFDYDNATKTFKRAESLKQNDISILVGLSKSLEKGMKIEQAMEKILDAVDIAPENLEVCKQYAHVLLSAQRYEKALDLIKTIDEKSGGKDLQVLDLYGQYFVCRGDEEAAETYFNKIRKLNHHYKDYMINAADRYIQTGNYEKAEKMASNFVDSRPQLPEGYNVLGTINSARGDLKKAKADYEKGISLKNPNIYAVKELEKIYNELEANKEIYNNDDMPIAVDADKLSKEEGGNIPEEDSQTEAGMSPEEQVDAMMSASADDDDLGSLEATPPIEQALMGEDGEFWEDFDDDPDAANKPLVEEDEEEGYDENEENSDLLSMMTPDAGEGEGSLENGLSEDEGDFDFSDFDDAAVESAPAAAEETAQADGNAAEPEADAEPEPVKPVNVPSSFEPEFDDEAPVKSVPLEAEPVAAPISTPEAQQMMNDLKQQQKELELQQRELALQQKEFADALKQENEKMIHETVEKAVEEKFSEYDLQPEPVIEEAAAEEEEAVVEEEPVVEEEAAVEEPVIEEEPLVEEPEFEEEAAVEEEASVEEPEFEEESPAEEEVIEEEFAEEELDLPEEEVPVEEIAGEDSEVLAEQAAMDGFDGCEDFDSDEEGADASEYEDDADDLMLQPFVTVEELRDLCGEPAAQTEDLSDAGDFADITSTGSAPEAQAQETKPAAPEEMPDDYFITADDMVDKIGRILNDDDRAKSCAAELELFKKLRVLSRFLPEKDKNSFDCCRMRMVIEYIIQKLSGKPGLLITAESLIKSGVLGEEYNRQLEDCCEEELSNDLIRHVITDMKKLAAGLEDQELCNALCVSADGILEQIALLDQKVSIF